MHTNVKWSSETAVWQKAHYRLSHKIEKRTFENARLANEQQCEHLKEFIFFLDNIKIDLCD